MYSYSKEQGQCSTEIVSHPCVVRIGVFLILYTFWLTQCLSHNYSMTYPTENVSLHSAILDIDQWYLVKTLPFTE